MEEPLLKKHKAREVKDGELEEKDGVLHAKKPSPALPSQRKEKDRVLEEEDGELHTKKPPPALPSQKEEKDGELEEKDGVLHAKKPPPALPSQRKEKDRVLEEEDGELHTKKPPPALLSQEEEKDGSCSIKNPPPPSPADLKNAVTKKPIDGAKKPAPPPSQLHEKDKDAPPLSTKNTPKSHEEEKGAPPFSTKNLPKNACHAPVKKEKNPPHETPTSLAKEARKFAKSAAGTSMATAAEAFCCAAEEFASGKDRRGRVIDTGLNKSAMTLFRVADGAPSSENELATVAMKLTHAAQMVLLSDNDTKTGAPGGWWRWKGRFLRAISARDTRLPLYSEPEKQMVEKREVLYALALATPIALLTAAAGLKVFQGGWAWVAGISTVVWILGAGGMVLNQYTVFNWELMAARHLGRLGILGAAVLFSFFTYRAFFPSVSWAICLLLLITAVALGAPWILSCVRGDDDLTIASAKSNGASKMEMPARRWTI